MDDIRKPRSKDGHVGESFGSGEPGDPLESRVAEILARNGQGAENSQSMRRSALLEAARFWRETFGLRDLGELAPSQVLSLVEHWKSLDSGNGTVQCKLRDLRWLLCQVGKAAFLPHRYSSLGIASHKRGKRQGLSIEDSWTHEFLLRIRRPRLQGLVLLARWFGMEFKEATLFRPHQDAEPLFVRIRRGTTGGRERYVRIVTKDQRRILEDVASLVPDPDGCLLPPGFPYVRWRKRIYEILRKAGLSKKSGRVFLDFRRTFAIKEMERLTAGGMARRAAARIVAKELGLSRVEYLANYLRLRRERADAFRSSPRDLSWVLPKPFRKT